MSYFSNFPKIDYDVEGNGITRRVVDILRRVGISDKIKNNVAAFRLRGNPSSARPEVVADKQYGESGTFWIHLLMNETIDPMYDWVLDDTTFEAFLDVKYPGSTFFVDYTDSRDESSSSTISQSSASSVGRTSSSSVASETSSSSSTRQEQSSSSSSSSPSSPSSNSSSSETSSKSISSSSSSSPSSSTSLSSSSTLAEATSQSSLSSSSTDNSVSSLSSSSSTQQSLSSQSSSTEASFSESSTLTTSSSSSSSVEIGNFTVGETVTFSDSRTGVVYQWDSTYRRLVVTGITDYETTVDLMDTLVIGQSSGAAAYIRRVFPESKYALHHFEADIVDDLGHTLFANVVVNPADYIVGYIDGIASAAVVTNFEHEHALNEAKRNIFVADRAFVPSFKSDLSRLISK